MNIHKNSMNTYELKVTKHTWATCLCSEVYNTSPCAGTIRNTTDQKSTIGDGAATRDVDLY